MNGSFFIGAVVTAIRNVEEGYTKPGHYRYGNRFAYELGFRLSGSSYSSSCGKTYKVEENQVVFKPKGIDDVCITESGTRYYSIWFDLKNNPPFGFYVFKSIDAIKTRELFKALISREKEYGTDLKCFSLLYEILNSLGGNEQYMPKTASELFSMSSAYISANFRNSELTVKKIAEEFGVSTSHLREVFYAKTSSSPIKYLLNTRIIHAEKLLKFSDHTINEISEMCGYESQFYFSRAFKKYKGISPLAFRKSN